MNERLTELPVSFSTADAVEAVELRSKGPVLEVRYRQWQTPVQVIRFEGMLHFKWDDMQLEALEVSPEGIYEVRGSLWLAGVRFPRQKKHFRIYFISESAALDVIADSFEYRNEN